MPFLTECSFCSNQVRVPDRATGGSMECRKCHSYFTIVPVSNLPRAKVGPRVKPRKSPVPPQPVTTSPPPVEERIREMSPTASPPPHPDLTTAEDTRDDFEPTRTSPALPPADASDDSPVEPAPVRRWRIPFLGAAAFSLGSVALLLASIPHLDLLTVPVSAAGLLVGVASILVALAAPKPRLGFPIAGTVVSVAVLAVSVFRPDLLGINRPVADEAAQATSSRQTVVARGRSSGVGATVVEEGEWVDVSRGTVQHDDVRLRLLGVAVEAVEIKVQGKQQTTKEKNLTIRLRLTNIGASRRVDYQSWGDAGAGSESRAPILKDTSDNVYRLRAFASGTEVVGQTRTAHLFPGKSTDDLLVFEAPPANVESLRLELPASAFGSPGKVRLALKIPARRQEKR